MHKHLTWTDRLKIEKGLKEGLKPCAIADRLHVHNTTIYRELKRGRYTHLNSDLTTEERYSPEIAQQRYEENLKAKGGELKIGNDYELSAFFEKKIYLDLWVKVKENWRDSIMNLNRLGFREER